MDALAHMMPPGAPKALAGLLLFLIFFELQAMITSSIPSPPMTDQPSSLKPLIASLNPLKEHNIRVINKQYAPSQRKSTEVTRVLSISYSPTKPLTKCS